MSVNQQVLSSPSLLLIFAYSPAGLGHLRVTETLFHSLPKNTTPLLLGAQDKSVGFLHRIISYHVIIRRFSEWIQRGIPEDIFTIYYRNFLHTRSNMLYKQLMTIIDERVSPPKTVLMVATHFGLAHELSAIKELIAREKKVRVILIVQVTDDSPQHIWYVPKADLIAVPSLKTKNVLVEYGKKSKLEPVRFEVVPYPVCIEFTNNLSQSEFNLKKSQLEYTSHSQIHTAIPISGAAVHLHFYTKLMEALNKKSERFRFHVVTKAAKFTGKFINNLLGKSYINLIVSDSDREVVEKYEQLYLKTPISLEITKPSEQVFKVLINPDKIGGSLLLLAEPVGRQEYDNVDFLRRHDLAPSENIQKTLWLAAQKEDDLSEINKEILEKVTNWRALVLPYGSVQSANFIWWCLKSGIFSKMLRCRVLPRTNDPHENEIADDGAKQLWEKTSEILLKDSG